MCYQVVEVYRACRCLYYQHAVDRCASYGRLGHEISKRTIPVGYACSTHTQDKRFGIPGAQNRAALVPEQIEKGIPLMPKDNNLENIQHSFHSPAASTNPKKTFQPTQGTRSWVDELNINYAEKLKAKLRLAEDSDSGDSIDSRSIISQASTATTVDENALEALFSGLLNRHGLYNLWPQIIEGQSSRSDARQTIERFLRRFAEDLECLATKTNDAETEESHRIVLSSSRFIRRHRAEIALRICQAHETQHRSPDADADAENTEIFATEEAPDTDGDPFAFSIAEKFIFGTEPILYLETNICAFIQKRQQRQFSRFGSNLRSFTSLAVQLFRQRPIPAGNRRVSWTCNCGCRVIDDYESKYEGAIEAFEYRLREYNQASQSVQQDNDTSRSNVMAQHALKGAIPTTLQWFHKALTKAKSPGLPSHQQNHNGPPIQLGSCVRSAGTAQAYHNFVLLCVPYLRWGLRLHNSEVCRINSDQQFFELLRQCYFGQRRGTIREALRIFTKVRALQFVQFEVFRNKLVDVRVCPSMPTASNDYTYDPMPPDAIPPIGPNLLMHLFENPDHADITLFLYHRFPKKLKAQLEACPTKGSSIGWGVEFVEGVDWYAVFVSGCLGFLFCLLFAVAWAAARGDVQGGFGIASFLLTFFIFCAGILHYMI
ncbi:hypothetical protein F4801DRAFT_562481 [Xylaria longipes]|nr:hypothetical protein F4801DRAFT_562481 [Xylaria longipes]